MQKPEIKPPPASIVPILLAALAALMAGGGMMLLLPWFGWVFLIAAGVFALGAFHYVFWGWWLGGLIRSDVEAEEEEQADRP